MYVAMIPSSLMVSSCAPNVDVCDVKCIDDSIALDIKPYPGGIHFAELVSMLL
jgi:hypothetical protein